MTAPFVLGLTGRAGAGKDTIGAELVKDFGYSRVAFADALKQVAFDSDPLVSALPENPAGRGGFQMIRLSDLVRFVGWDYAKTTFPDVRRYLQRLGVAMRDAQPGVWVTLAARAIRAELDNGRNVVVTDVRFADEVDAIHAFGGVVFRVIGRDGRDLGANAGHVSELTDALDYDATLNNNGTPQEAARAAHGWAVRRLNERNTA